MSIWKRIVIGALAFGVIALSAACGNSDARTREEISGKVFVWEKEGFGGDFSIRLNDDGTYTYSEGFLSSYLAFGDWTVKAGILTMKEGTLPDTGFRFKVKEGELIFLSEGSSQFLHASVENGDRFLPKDTE